MIPSRVTSNSRTQACLTTRSTITSTRRSNTARSMTTPTTENSSSTIQVLALHGAEGNAQEFQRGLTELAETAFFAHGVTLDIRAVNAPHPRGDGYAWWTLPPGVRSKDAKEYQGIQESIERISQAVHPKDEGGDNKAKENASSCPDLVVAHSQGAILTTALLATNQWPSHPPPKLGYILNGGAWPNPYTEPLETVQLPSSCRVLIVTGEADRINPPEGQVRVQQALADAGASVTTIQHSGGHGVPTRNVDAVDQIVDWIVQGLRGT